MKGIMLKEFRQLFITPMGYIYLGVFMIIGGVYFTLYNLMAGSIDIRNYFSPMMSTVIFLVPMLTMRSFSEEKKMRTEQLLFSSPISSLDIVLGKFFAAFIVFLTGIAFSLIYVLILSMQGSLSLLVVLGNYIGIIVAGASFIAIGLFISSLTENQIIAAIITYAAILGLWLIGYSATYISSSLISRVVVFFSAASRFSEFTMGIFDFSTVIYYISLAALFLTFVVLNLELQKRGIGRGKEK